jgi:hypothetical protein
MAALMLAAANLAGDHIVVAGDDLHPHPGAAERRYGGPGAFLGRIEKRDIAEQRQLAPVGDHIAWRATEPDAVGSVIRAPSSVPALKLAAYWPSKARLQIWPPPVEIRRTAAI